MTSQSSDAAQKRAAMNQTLFRELNERLERVNRDARFVDFFCECVDPDCSSRVRLTLDEYEALRKVPNHFVVQTGHDVRALERVYKHEEGRYTIVEKFGVGEEIAAHFNPRTRERIV